MHSHSHADGQHHHHGPVVIDSVNRALVIGIVLNLVFVAVEAGFGFYTHSLSLLSDAGHNLADVATLALSLLAFRLLKVKPNRNYTYGYRKTSILVALFNSMVLLISIGAISIEAIQRFIQPEPLPGATIAIVAAIGIVINGTTAFFFFRDKDKDLNIKSAYLHLLADALVSLALVIGGLVIYYTGWYWLDPVLGIGVAVVILFGTWGLLKDSLKLSLDGVPGGVDMDAVEAVGKDVKGLVRFYHIHVWAISTTQNALTAHLVLEPSVSTEEEETIKEKIRHDLLHLNVHHITLETERPVGDPKTGCENDAPL